MNKHPLKFFYGWWNVATGFVGMGLSYAMFTVFIWGTFVNSLESSLIVFPEAARPYWRLRKRADMAMGWN